MKSLKVLARSNRGFSLVEVMIVIALIAVAGTFVTGQLYNRMNEGYQTTAKTQMNGFKQMLEDYRRYCGIYPTTNQGLEALIAKPTQAPDCPNYPAGGFLPEGKLPTDPWGTAYQYESPDEGKSFVITSLGGNRSEGGDGFDRDIKSNE
jgi:general secretion pathway protein G